VRTITVPLSDGQELPLKLPDSWRVLRIARPGSVPSLSDPVQAVTAAVSRPLQMPPLALIPDSDTQVVIVLDETYQRRPAPALVEAVMGVLLGAGVQARRIQFLLSAREARGVAAPSPEGLLPDAAAGCRLLWHDPGDRSAHVRLGMTPSGTPAILSRAVAGAQLRIAVSLVEPHRQAAFTGGWMPLAPGCMHCQTAEKLQPSGIVWPLSRQLGEDPDANPMQQEIRQVARHVPWPTFCVSGVADIDGRLVDVAAGHPADVLRQLAPTARRLFGVPISQQADIVIATANPRPDDLVEGVRCYGNVAEAARPGGVLVTVVDGDGGLDRDRLTGLALPPAWVLRPAAGLLGGRAVLSMTGGWFADLEPREAGFLHAALAASLRNRLVAYHAGPTGLNSGLPFLDNYDEPQAMWQRLTRLVGHGHSPSVIVFPHGGLCYPIRKR